MAVNISPDLHWREGEVGVPHFHCVPAGWYKVALPFGRNQLQDRVMKIIYKFLIVGLLSGSYVGCAHDGGVKDTEKAAPAAIAQTATTAVADSSVAATVAQLRDSLVTIKPGTLAMGDASNKTQSPVHNVQLRSFAMTKYLITRGEFAAFVSENDFPSTAWRKPRIHQTDRDPVVNVSWQDAQAFAQWLSKKTNQNFRLPTEAEWEYAARASTSTRYFWGAEVGNNQANCYSCGSRWDNDGTAPVGSFAPNAWGLHDMAGNAAEWVQDCYSADYQSAPLDGSAATNGDCKYRVVRGGSWNESADNIGSASRDSSMPDFRYSTIGFRLVREIK